MHDVKSNGNMKPIVARIGNHWQPAQAPAKSPLADGKLEGPSATRKGPYGQVPGGSGAHWGPQTRLPSAGVGTPHQQAHYPRDQKRCRERNRSTDGYRRRIEVQRQPSDGPNVAMGRR